MKTPKRIEPLIEDGLVDEVLRPLMSGKEAAVYVVRCGNELRCAICCARLACVLHDFARSPHHGAAHRQAPPFS